MMKRNAAIRYLSALGYQVRDFLISLLFDVEEISDDMAIDTHEGFSQELNPTCTLTLSPIPFQPIRKPRTVAEYHTAQIRMHMTAMNRTWDALEAHGCRPGAYDFDADRTAIIRGDYPDGQIVGYLNGDLTISRDQ